MKERAMRFDIDRMPDRQIVDRMERQLLEHGPIAVPHPGIAG